MNVYVEKVINTWGVEKTVELVLIAVCAATASVIVGNYMIPSKPVIETIEKEN